MKTARWLVVVAASVFACFLGSVAYVRHVDAGQDSRIRDIVGDAMPSVQALAVARGDLHRLDDDLDRYIEQQGADVADEMLADRHNLEAAFATYTLLPQIPGETALVAPVRSAIADLGARLDALRAGFDPARARQLHLAVADADQGIERLVKFNAQRGQQLGLEVAAVRSQTGTVRFALQALSVLLACGALVLALRQLRSFEHRHTVAEHEISELASRVDELGQFAGRVAHDVLSPLSTSMFAFDVVERACTEPSAVRALDKGRSSLRRVQTLVDGLLEFARAGGSPEPGAVAEVAPVLEDVLDGLVVQAEAARIRLELHEVPEARVACSLGVLTSLVSNFVRNAIRHMGDAKQRRIDISVRRADRRWRVEVKDTGPGIPKGQERRIFKPHVQLGQSSGIGLGLATVDRLVSSHGGAAGVISPPEGGALFWFELPEA